MLPAATTASTASSASWIRRTLLTRQLCPHPAGKAVPPRPLRLGAAVWQLPNPDAAPARDNEAMASGLIRCGHSGQANRVPAAAAGTPRCGKCHQPLSWIAEADDTTFGDVADAAKIP